MVIKVEDEKFYLLIVGSRTFDNYEAMKKNTDYMLQNYKDVVIVSGGAKGTDTLAEKYAHERNFEFVEFPAQWDKYGNRAGYIRNEEMHKFIAQHNKRGCLAFWDGESRGTKHNFPLCKKYNNPLRIIEFHK